ncbi:conjugal transfer protein, partial [Streptomyces sp. NPDC002265]|uniref:conjugal transfer protein n=1 Tax=Streptomyces sp. NPDC002265 TaxID=3154415 RepID=UPI003327859F
MSPGTQASPSEAAAPMPGGARLEAMRRRVRLSRLAIWMVIAAGPAALAVAVASSATRVEAATATRPTVVRTATAAADPAGYAQVFVSAWLRSSADDATSAQSRLAQSMAPDVALPSPAAGAQSSPQSVTTVRSAQRKGGAWSVTVAAQYADGRLRFYAVPVAADASGASFTVTGAPGVVAGPARAEVAKSPYGVSVPQGDLSSAVGEFLAAYLTGAGEVSRYLAPGVQMSAVVPA